MSAKTGNDSVGSLAGDDSAGRREFVDESPPLERPDDTIQSARRSGWDLIFPPQCLCCVQQFESHGSPSKFCEMCEAELVPTSGPKCPACGLRGTSWQVDDGQCVACRNQGFRFDRTIAFGSYTGVLRDVAIGMKHDMHEILTREVAAMFAKHVADVWTGALPDVVVDVPVHWLRKFNRGTHVSRTLARYVAEALETTPTIDVLTCRRRMMKQGTLLPDQRRRNVRGAFAVAKPEVAHRKHVLVVDDVMTTGSTLHEIAKVLKRQKATKVTVAVVARGIGDGVDAK